MATAFTQQLAERRARHGINDSIYGGSQGTRRCGFTLQSDVAEGDFGFQNRNALPGDSGEFEYWTG